MRGAGTVVTTSGAVSTDPVTYVGLQRPEGLPEGSTVITLDTLNQLVPA